MNMIRYQEVGRSMVLLDEISAAVIQQEVARNFRISHRQLLLGGRAIRFSYPRMLAMYLIRELTSKSFPWIAKEFGGFDHTTVIHACRWARDNEQYQEYIKDTLKRLGKPEDAMDR